MTLRKKFKRFLYSKVPGFAGSFPYCGVRVFFPPRSLQFRAAVEQGLFEGGNVLILQRLARPGTTMFDVGGHLGLMAIPVLKHVPTLSVVSFEPSPNTLPFLLRTAQSSPFSDRWTIIGKAASDANGTLNFHTAVAEKGMYDSFRDTQRAGAMKVVPVEATTLDQAWEELSRPRVSVVKIDVEGAETSVLSGARRMLQAERPHILMEWFGENLKAYNTAPEFLLSLADELGYSCFSLPLCIPIADPTCLQLQMLKTEEFLLAPKPNGAFAR